MSFCQAQLSPNSAGLSSLKINKLRVSEGCLKGVWKVSGRRLEGYAYAYAYAYGRCMEGVWNVCGRCLGGV